MEGKNIKDIVFSKQVVEFVTVANEFCILAEKPSSISAPELLEKCRRILSLLYLKAILLPKVENVLDDEVEKFVSEFEYNLILQEWMKILGEHDGFLEIPLMEEQFTMEPVDSSISECMADIYQDMKDFTTAYSIGNESVMNEALAACSLNFEQYWGQKIVSVLKPVHHLLAKKDIFESKKSNISGNKSSKEDNNWVDGFFDQFNEEE